METLLDIALLIFALGFFTFTIKNVNAQEDKFYARKLNEQREFGYQATKDKNSKR
jgi:hypothetical protein